MKSEKHDQLAEYLTRMQAPLGHHSWWYTNRSSEDCINVKMHVYPDIQEITSKLPAKTQKAIEILEIDVDTWVNTYVGNDKQRRGIPTGTLARSF